MDQPTVPPPKSNTPLSIAQQLDALELECKFRTVKLRQAARMKDVVQLCKIEIRGDLTSRQSEIRGLKQLQLAGEARLRELIGSHMLELRNIRDLQLLIQMRSHYQHREWAFLKAIHPMLFREADGEAERIQRHLERETDSKRERQRG
jgi:hypothetical protein